MKRVKGDIHLPTRRSFFRILVQASKFDNEYLQRKSLRCDAVTKRFPLDDEWMWNPPYG